MAHAPRLVVRAVETGVRPVKLRLPFRFGNTTLTSCDQVFVRAVVEVAGQGTAQGYAAEMMVPGWFDKRETRSPAQNVADLAHSIRAAAEIYTNQAPCSAFELFGRNQPQLGDWGRREGMTALSASFGAAVLDRAVIDAMCRGIGTTFFDAIRGNAVGLCDSDMAADMRGFGWDAWLPSLVPQRTICARHTIGILDEIEARRYADDGLPASLPAAIERYGHRDFKIKLGGDADEDVRRLSLIFGVLDTLAPGHRSTLDGNEQYSCPESLAAFAGNLKALSAARRRPESLRYLEQPIPRDISFDGPVPATRDLPWLLDEADGSVNAFVTGKALGWTGVSSKGCKGIYKSFINRARCERWNAAASEPRFFMSAEDLCCQAGFCVQQDLAIASALGLHDAERNGHHYVDGLSAAPVAEQEAFTAGHPDLYESSAGHPRVRIENGMISLHSLFTCGFGSGVSIRMDGVTALEKRSQDFV